MNFFNNLMGAVAPAVTGKIEPIPAPDAVAAAPAPA